MRDQTSAIAVDCLPISRQGSIDVRLQQDFETKRRAISEQLLNRLRARLTDMDRLYLDNAFRDLQDEFLRTPLSAIKEETAHPAAYTLAEAMGRLFGLLPATSRPPE